MNFDLLKKDPPVAQFVAVVMLVWALAPINPYSYYVLLRFVVCGIFVFLAVKANKLNKPGWTWVLGITEVVYNPLAPAHLNREVWSVVNIVTIVLLIVTVWVFRQGSSPQDGGG